MSKGNLMKFRYGSKKGIFTYALVDGDFVSLSYGYADKIKYIKEHGAIDMTLDMKSETYDLWAVDIIDDPAVVKRVYDHFIEQGTAYFDEGTDGLVVLRFHR